jgi:predicted nucleic acid-binding protein
MLVIDASATADLLLARPNAERIAARVAEHFYRLHAPHLLDVEVLSVLRRLVIAGDASDDRAGEALSDLLDLRIERYAHDILAPRIWQLRANFSAYDGAYVALAEALTDGGVPLLTADVRLARAVRDHTGLAAITPRD